MALGRLEKKNIGILQADNSQPQNIVGRYRIFQELWETGSKCAMMLRITITELADCYEHDGTCTRHKTSGNSMNHDYL